MHLRCDFIYAYAIFIGFVFIIGCWESLIVTGDIAVTPRVVYRGEITNLSVQASTPVFENSNIEAFISPDEGIRLGRLVLHDAAKIKIPLTVDSSAPLGKRIFTFFVNGAKVTEEISVMDRQLFSNDLSSDNFETEIAQISISPSVVYRGDRVGFVISGVNTNFTADTSVSFGPDSGIAISNIVVESSTKLTFDGEVSRNATPGIRTLRVSGPSGQTVKILAVELEVLSAVTCYDDDYEVNNTIGQATPLNFPSTINASICEGDHDYFKINIQSGVAVDFFLQFTHSDGDLDMELLTLQGQRLATSFSRTDNELIMFTVPEHQSGERVLHIFGYGNAINNYILRVNVSGEDNCVDDQYEPNDHANAAFPISFPASFNAMICKNDDDFYLVNIPNAITFEVSALFNHSLGNLDLALLSSSNEVLAISESQDDNEVIVYTTNQADSFKIRVYAENGHENGYLLKVNEIETDTDTDTDTDNDSDTNADSDSDSDYDSDTEVLPVCINPELLIDPPFLTIGRYSSRITIESNRNSDWVTGEVEIFLSDLPENIYLEGCTVSTPWQISCNITVGLLVKAGDIRVDAAVLGKDPVCGVLTILDDRITDAKIPLKDLPNKNIYLGRLSVQDNNRSDFFHIRPNAGDMLVFHAVSMDRENMDPIIRLIEDNGNNWLFYFDDETPLGIDSRTTYFFSESRDYYVEVGPKFSHTFGDYQFLIYRLTHGRRVQETNLYNNTLETAQVIAPEMPFIIYGAISDESDADVYRIITDRPAAVDVVARRLGPWDSSTVDAELAVYNEQQILVDSNSTWFEVPLSSDPRVFLPSAGTYYILVSPALKDSSQKDGERHTGFYAVNIREQVVINEIDNRAASDNPFIEFIGPPNFSLAGYSLATYGNEGMSLIELLPLDDVMTDAAGYAVFFEESLENQILTEPGPGAVVLYRDGTVADAVQFGVFDSDNMFAEGYPAAVGYERTIGRGAGVDTNNNDLDFIYMAKPTPGAPNDRTFMSPVPLYGEGDDCFNGRRDANETGLDCGGVCGPCPDGQRCLTERDCRSSLCLNGICVPNDTCFDFKKNQNESDVDCGGVCPGCPLGAICNGDFDCLSGFCEAGVCSAAQTCEDEIKNQDETDVDCGGLICEGCENGLACIVDFDCLSGFCNEGVCAVEETCNDGIKNQNETDVDCGGVCPKCSNDKKCLVDSDCIYNNCASGTCVRLTGSVIVTNNWGSGYCASLRVTNHSQTAVSSWYMQLHTRGAIPYTIWNVIFSGGSSPYTVIPAYTWNSSISGGSSIEVGGYCANVAGSYLSPFIVSVKGE